MYLELFMTDPTQRGSGSRQRPNKLLSIYVSDPQAPRSDEVERLVSELEVRLTELEVQNQELQEARRQLEAYRDRYVDLYDFAPLGYATLDEDGYVQEINLAGAKMLGEDRDVITGYAFGDYVAKEDQEAFQDHVRKCAGDRCEVTSELGLVDKDGRSMVVQLRSMPIEGAKEHALCKTAITDITKRKRAEEAVHKSHHRLTTVMESITDAFFGLDRDFRLTYVNREAERLFRRARQESLGRSLWELFPEAVGSRFQREYERAMAESTTIHFEEFYPPFNQWFDVHAYPSPAGLSVYFQDISDRKRAEEAMRESEERFRAVVETAHDAIVVIDDKGLIRVFNAAAGAMFGLDIEGA